MLVWKGVLIKELKKYSNDSIKITLRYIKDEEIEIYFKASDVVVLPYLEFSQSGVLFLAYSFGKPVIAPNIGNFSRDIINGKTGYIFKTGCSDDLSEKICLYFDNLGKNPVKLKKQIKEFSNKNYSWIRTGNELKKYYHKARV